MRDYTVAFRSPSWAVHGVMTVCAVGKSDAFEIVDEASKVHNPYMEIVAVEACQHEKGVIV